MKNKIVHVFVVSHGHGEIISKIDVVNKLSKGGIKTYIKNNRKDIVLDEYIKRGECFYYDEEYGLGFGENNNFLFNKAFLNGDLKPDDYILILNPDVDITASCINNLVSEMHSNADAFATLNLYNNYERTSYDCSVRRWPTLYNFLTSYFFGFNTSIIDKSKIDKPTPVEWVAGSFMAIRASLFMRLNGFDEGYFMYCEDIDICYRSAKIGHKVVFYPHHYAVHLASHQNRKLFSAHFRWHLKSIMRYFLCKSL